MAIIIYLDNFNAQQREICGPCTAQGLDYRGQIPLPVCRVARLEKELGHIPTDGEVKAEGIDATRIPLHCPNGYTSPRPEAR